MRRRGDAAAERPDGQLLECFVSRSEEAVLAALVLRHGPMVIGQPLNTVHPKFLFEEKARNDAHLTKKIPPAKGWEG